jgi:hypothetical protein
MYSGLPDAERAVIPGTSHGLLVEKPALCNTIILDFLANDPVRTLAPIRRAQPPGRRRGSVNAPCDGKRFQTHEKEGMVRAPAKCYFPGAFARREDRPQRQRHLGEV